MQGACTAPCPPVRRLPSFGIVQVGALLANSTGCVDIVPGGLPPVGGAKGLTIVVVSALNSNKLNQLRQSVGELGNTKLITAAVSSGRRSNARLTPRAKPALVETDALAAGSPRDRGLRWVRHGREGERVQAR